MWYLSTRYCCRTALTLHLCSLNQGVVTFGACLQSNAPPESWRLLERFVNQEQHFRPWGSPLPETLPLAEDMWRPPSAREESSEGAPSEHASSSSRCSVCF